MVQKGEGTRLHVYSISGPHLGRLTGSWPVKAPHCLTSVQFSPTSRHLLVAYGRPVLLNLAKSITSFLLLFKMNSLLHKSTHSTNASPSMLIIDLALVLLIDQYISNRISAAGATYRCCGAWWPVRRAQASCHSTSCLRWPILRYFYVPRASNSIR